MATLRDQHKRWIIQQLAMFVGRKEIIDQLQSEGVHVSYSQIAYYDPAVAGNGLGQSWRELHAQTRAAFLKGVEGIAISHRSFRLRELEDMYRHAKKMKNYGLAAELLERAAKEMGEAYTNRRVVEAGDPVEAVAKMLGITPEEVRGAVALDALH